MWWRVLGVAVVLLGAGVAGGYAVAERTAEEPLRSAALEPVPAVSPAVPTPVEHEVRPDPDAPRLEPGLPSSEQELRITKRGAGVALLVPDGWTVSRLPDSRTWVVTAPINTLNTYGLRIELPIGEREAATVAKGSRIAALESAEAEGNLFDLDVTTETDTGFEATYITPAGYRRLTMEQWIANESGIAYAELAVTGRLVDEAGLRDLLARTAESVRYLEPLPKTEQDES